MNTELEEKEKQRNHLKLMKSYHNNIKISDMNLQDKYTYFEDSKLDESKTLLYEINVQPTRFKRYSRGSIIKVKFGVNIGSEFSGDHYAIVVSKQDTMYSTTLHVIPITSKKHTKNMSIGCILYNQEEIDKLTERLKTTINKKEKKKIERIIKYYTNRKNRVSYACIDHLKTISKISILRGMNEYDYINSLKCSSELMKSIDEAIIKEYTL